MVIVERLRKEAKKANLYIYKEIISTHNEFEKKTTMKDNRGNIRQRQHTTYETLNSFMLNGCDDVRLVCAQTENLYK